MNCRGCGGANRDGARFCTFCGAVLTLTCSSCGTDLLEGARFCDSCGTPVAAEPAAEPVAAARKVVTVVFADMTGSTSLEEQLDAEAVRSLVDRFYAALRAEVDKRGGRVVKFTGDGLMAAFGVPEVHEDDAARAVEAAVAMCAACESLAGETGHTSIALKVGINTGEVVVIEDDDDVVGDAVNIAARLEGAAGTGEVLVGEGTWRLTRGSSRYDPVEPLVLKGKSEPVPAYRLISLDEETVDTLAAPFVGRDAELEKLVAVFEDAVQAKAARLVTIIGSPGLGKTRLARELAAQLADRAVVRETRCDPAAATFAPIAEALREANAIPEAASEEEVLSALLARIPEDEPDRERIAMRAGAILGAGQPGSTEETFWALRRMIETAATRDLPRVMVLEDLHWAEPLLLDLVEHLAEWIRDAPVLLVGTGRPELRDIRPSLTEGGRAHAIVSLEGLDERATEQLAIGLLGSEDVPRELLAKIPASTEGNPLFVREFVRMLVDDGVLRRDGDAWHVTVDVDAIEVPPTIQSLLAARMDRLRPDERTVVELASVVGKEFYPGAVRELAPPAVREQLDSCFESLRRKELVEPVGTYWIDEPVYRFHHVLIREAAYRRLLKESRADLHDRLARWLDDKTGGVIGEHEETIGYHLEQAHEYLRQLGRLDDRAVEIGRRAAELLGQAAQRALDRDDLPAAASLSGRALDRLGPDDPERSNLLLVRCEALLSMGDVSSGARSVAELERIADSPRLSAWATCFAGQLSNYTEPERLRETEKRVASAAAELADLGDPAGAAKAHTVHGSTLARLGRFAECETALDAALTAAREANDRRRITAVLGSAPLAALWGPNPVSRAGGRCLDLVRLSRITTGSPGVEVTSTRCQAVLEAFRGRADAARRMLGNARRTLEELGLQHELLETELFAGIVELVAGDAAAAEPHLRSAHDGFRFVGVDVLAAQSAALLARTYLHLGEIEDAERFADESERLGGQDLKASIAWRAVRAEILARRGEFEEARALAESAVDLASRTDALIDHGDACQALAAVCAAAGDAAAARSASERALALYERKGATALLEAVTPSSLTASPAPVTSAPQESLDNECIRVLRDFLRRFEDGDWERVAALHREDFSMYDRRLGLGMTYSGRDTQVEVLKGTAEVGTTNTTLEPIATRGSRLSLVSTTWSGPTETAFAAEFLAVSEIDKNGRIFEIVVFALDDFDAAMAELDERFAAGEGAFAADAIRFGSALTRAHNSRDWTHFREKLADDLTVIDLRPAGLGEIHGADEWIDSIHALVALTSTYRMETVAYLRIVPTMALLKQTNQGTTSDGGAFENALYCLVRLSGDRVAQIEMYPTDQLDAALARFEEFERGSITTAPIENACTRLLTQIWSRFKSRDWDGLSALLSDTHVIEDRRPGLQIRSEGLEATLQWLEAIASLGGEVGRLRVLAVRGERLALANVAFVQGAGKTFEAEGACVFELGDQGLLETTVGFDADDLEAAFTELDERFLAQLGDPAYRPMVEAAARFNRASNARDLAAVTELVTQDFVLVDHFPAGAGEIVSREEILDYLGAMNELITSRYQFIAAVHALVPGLALVQLLSTTTMADGSTIGFPRHVLAAFREGYISRLEFFPVEKLAEGRARFEELSRGSAGAGRLENACTRVADRLGQLFADRDWEDWANLIAEDAVHEDRRSLVRDPAVGRAGVVALMKSAADIGTVGVTWDPIAIRGQRLALFRITMRGRDLGSGAFGMEVLQILELDEEGLAQWSVNLDEEALDAAFDELDARFLASEGRLYADALETLTALMRAINERDWEAMRRIYTDDASVRDHRPVSLGVLDADAHIDSLKELVLLVPFRAAVVAYHALASDRIVFEQLNRGKTSDGAAVELTFQNVMQVRDGRLRRWEFFPVDELDTAMVRFDELERPGRGPAEPAAATALRRFAELMTGDDFDALADLHAKECVLRDRRSVLHSDMLDRAAVLEHLRSIWKLGATRSGCEVIATRGDRLALVRLHFGVADEDGYDVALLSVAEVDADGRISRRTTFDSDDLGAAFDELEERFLAGEGARHSAVWQHIVVFHRLMNERDWDAVRDTYATDLQLVDHRPASLGNIQGAAGMVEAARTLAEVVPDLRWIIKDVLRLGDHGGLARMQLAGTTEGGGPMELEFLVFFGMRDGRTARLEFFPEEQRDRAIARFEELGADSFRQIENTCSRFMRRFCAACAQRQWEEVAAAIAGDAIGVDRRRGLRGRATGRDEIVAMLKINADLGADSVEVSTIATRGERLALLRLVVRGSDSGAEIEFVSVYEVNDERQLCYAVAFDPDDLDGAFAELDGRYVEDEGAPYEDLWWSLARVVRHMNSRTWDAFRREFADDHELVDHRPAGLGRIAGGDGPLTAAKTLTEVVPDMYWMTTGIHRIGRSCGLVRMIVSGTSESGGPIEMGLLSLFERKNGRRTRQEFFAEDQLDLALGRFDELAAAQVPSLENACTRNWDRMTRLYDARDWEEYAETLNEDVVFEDRRKGLSNRVEGRGNFVENMKFIAEMRAAMRHELLATRGERLAMFLLNMYDPRGRPGSPQVFALHIHEVDDKGRLLSVVIFDPEDEASGVEELDRRFISGEAQSNAEVFALCLSQAKAYNARDWDTYRRGLHGDLFFVDMRPASAGTLLGAEAHIEYVKTFIELAPSATLQILDVVAIAPDRLLAHHRVQVAGGDAEAELAMLVLYVLRDGRFARIEAYPLDRRRDAFQRFEECAGPLPRLAPPWARFVALGLRESHSAQPSVHEAPENAASRVSLEVQRCLDVRDWEGFRAVHATNVKVEDRRPGLRWEGIGVEQALARAQEYASAGDMSRASVRIAVRGDRLALVRVTLADSAGWRSERLLLPEVGDDGRLVFTAFFDGDDYDAAFAELDERYAVGEGAEAAELVRLGIRSVRTINERDWPGLRAVFADDLVFVDHRPASLGEAQGGDRRVHELRSLLELMSSYRCYVRVYHVLSRELAVGEFVIQGTTADGAHVDIDYHMLIQERDGRICRMEIFPIDQLVEALGRFDELVATEAPPESENLAYRSMVRSIAAQVRGDWEAVAASMTDDIVFDDRRRGLTWVLEGRGAVMEHLRLTFRSRGAVTSRESLLATRGEHLCLGRQVIAGGGYEVEVLVVNETDDEGATRRCVFFDPQAFDTAIAELDERYMEGEGADYADVWQSMRGIIRNYNARNWPGVRSNFADAAVLTDHRPVSLGVMTPDQWVDSMQVQVDLVPDMRFSFQCLHHLDTQVVVATAHAKGSTAEGAEVELAFHNLALVREGLIRLYEWYPVGNLSEAMARAAELSTAPDQI